MVDVMATETEFTISDLIAHLSLEAGRIMEDASVELALTLPTEPREQAARLERIQQADTDIVTLSAAAQALHHRYVAKPGRS